MIIKIKDKDVELKYTFNSFKYMEELDMSELSEIQNKPFKIISIVGILLLGAVNNSRRNKFTVIDVEEFLEEYINENSVADLLEELMKQLQESDFFKSLQKKNIEE